MAPRDARGLATPCICTHTPNQTLYLQEAWSCKEARPGRSQEAKPVYGLMWCKFGHLTPEFRGKDNFVVSRGDTDVQGVGCIAKGDPECSLCLMPRGMGAWFGLIWSGISSGCGGG